MTLGTILIGGAVWGGFNITYLLNSWAANGVFTYVLPFLLIFAFVYGLLAKSAIMGDNKGVNMIIALAVGGISLVGDYVPRFFQTIFPYTGMAISVLLAAVILGGLFFTELAWIKNIIFGVGAIAFVVVLFSSLSDYNFAGSSFWYDYGSSIIVIVLIIAAFVYVVKSGGSGAHPAPAGHV